MKNTVLLITLIIGLFSYGSVHAQNLDSVITQMEQELVGTWVLQDEDTHTATQYKLVFKTNRKVKEYQENQLLTTYENYSVVKNSCGNFPANNDFYLKLVYPDDDLSCSIITNLTSDVLALMSLRGEVLLFYKQ